MKEHKIQRSEKSTVQNTLVWCMVIGMIIGFAVMLSFGIAIDKISLGITTAPAVGAAIGFLIYGITNRRNKENSEKNLNTKNAPMLYAVLIAGCILFVSLAFYLVY